MNKSIIIIYICLFIFSKYHIKVMLYLNLINIANNAKLPLMRYSNQISLHDIFQRAANVDIRTALREYYGNITFFFSRTLGK